jgi:hypothetical protein
MLTCHFSAQHKRCPKIRFLQYNLQFYISSSHAHTKHLPLSRKKLTVKHTLIAINSHLFHLAHNLHAANNSPSRLGPTSSLSWGINTPYLHGLRHQKGQLKFQCPSRSHYTTCVTSNFAVFCNLFILTSRLLCHVFWCKVFDPRCRDSSSSHS